MLILEDEPDIARGMAEILQANRYEVVVAPTVRDAWRCLTEMPVDLAVLDVMLSNDTDAGFHFATQVRDGGFEGPILFTTARVSVDDRIQALDLGGDDYLVKPFSLLEFAARVRALLRRGGLPTQAVTRFGRMVLDTARRTVCLDERHVAVTDKEFRLLEYLAHRHEPLSADHLCTALFPDAESGAAVVRVYVRGLRRKLGSDAIVTVRGGYRLGTP